MRALGRSVRVVVLKFAKEDASSDKQHSPAEAMVMISDCASLTEVLMACSHLLT